MSLIYEPGVAAGAWIATRLGPFGARVGSLVPQGFEAYARVLHPATDSSGAPARWAEVAAACGTTLHPTAQFWRLVGAHDWSGGAGRWPGETPGLGTLDAASLAAVVEVLVAHTAGGGQAEVVAALWEGFGWVQGGGAIAMFAWTGEATPEELAQQRAEVADRNERMEHGAFGAEVLGGPRLTLPQRDYLLFRGALGEVPAVLAADGPWSVPGWGSWDQTPNLLWPVDESWCVATEIDLDSTVVGGAADLVDAILAHPGLEAIAVGQDDSLMLDGDTVNT